MWFFRKKTDDLDDYYAEDEFDILLYNPDEETEFLRYTDTMLSLREAILKANFQEAEWEFRQFSFYRCTLEKVAFIVNLKDYGDHVSVTYGFTSIVDQDHLKRYGEDNNDIKLRFYSVIRNEQDKIAVASEVKNVYLTYLDKSKDEMLSLKKEQQKQSFLFDSYFPPII